MTEQQIKNSIELCKDAPVSSVMRLMDVWRRSDIEDMARYFKCDNNKTTVAAHLIAGR